MSADPSPDVAPNAPPAGAAATKPPDPSTSSPAAQPGGADRRFALLALLLVLPVVGLNQFISHYRPDDRDKWLYAYYGRQLADGRHLYTELWDNKPPGIYWLNAAGMAVSGESRWGVIALCAVAQLLTLHFLFGAIRRSYGPAAAMIGTLLAALYLGHWLYHGGGDRPATFVMCFETAAATLYLAAMIDRSGKPLLAAGFLAGLALCFKQTAVALPVAIVLHQLWTVFTYRRGVGTALIYVVFFVLGWGAAVSLAGWGVYLTSSLDAGRDAIFAFGHDYLLSSRSQWWWPAWFETRDHLHVLALPLVLAAATVGHVLVTRAKVPANDTRCRGQVMLLTCWFLLALYLALIAPGRQAHYFAPALPPLMLLAGVGIGELMRSAGEHKWRRYHVWLAVLWFGYMAVTPVESQLQRAGMTFLHVSDGSPDARSEIAALLRKHCGPVDRLFVWGYQPWLLYHTNLPPAVRYPGTGTAELLGAKGQRIVDEIVAGLKVSPPKALVIPESIVRALVAGNKIDGFDFADLGVWISANYTLLDGDNTKQVWLKQE